MKLVSRKSEWIIFAGFAMIIIAALAESFLPKYDGNVTTLSDWRKYLELKQTWKYVVVWQIDWLGRVILATSLVTIGLRLLRLKLQKLKAGIFIVAGLGICAFNLTTSYFVMTFDYSIPKPNMELIKRNLESHNYDAKLKSKISRMYASDKYRYDGTVVEYFSEAGEKILYQPSKEELKFREQDVLVKEIWSDNRKRSRPVFYCWVGITTISLLLGLFTPIGKNRPIG